MATTGPSSTPVRPTTQEPPDAPVRPVQLATLATTDVGGGPNGIGMLPDGRLVVCQNGGSTFGTGWWPYDFDGCVQLFRPVGAAQNPVTPQLQLSSALECQKERLF